eukprot:m.48072 g.48072  ORF g.48072 m.48072 type:complete len:230 (-) comp11337_c0_seq2:14-703(-)
MRDWDAQLWSSLTWLTTNTVTPDLGLTFAAALPPGCPAAVWRPGGDYTLATPVTEENKQEYVECAMLCRLRDAVIDDLAAITRGLNRTLDTMVSRSFSVDEFSLLLCGVSTIDVDDWRRHTDYDNCSADDELITWFWAAVHDMSTAERTMLLLFCCGLQRVPCGGFARLEGLNGPHLFTIAVTSDPPQSLPTASTCFNTLRLPQYPSDRVLRSRLLTAVRFGHAGFAFA